MSEPIQVIQPGQTVIIGGDVSAIVASVCIEAGNAVQYKCVWWDGRNRKAEWLNSHEVTYSSAKTLSIGFIQSAGEK